jgi:predicted small secreted protein
MNTRHTTLTIAAAAAMAAALAGCNTTADAGSITSATKTPTSATTAPATPTASTSTTVDPAAKEAQDRQAAELVWRRFNGLAITIAALPADQVEPSITQVAVDPELTRLRDAYAKLKAQHQAGYGQTISYLAWPQPIDGKDTAVLSDCQDGSQAGFLDTQTGNKLTVGTPNAPARGTLQRTPDGWRVANSEALLGETCTPGK